MEYFSPVPLSSAGRPIPLDEEVDIRNIDKVSFHVQNDKVVIHDLFLDAILILTNFRVIVILSSTQTTQQSSSSSNASTTTSTTTSVAWGFPLKDIARLEDCSTMWTRSKRVKIHFHQRKNYHDIGIKFHAGEKEEFIEICQRVLAKKSWEKVTTKTVFQTLPPPPPTSGSQPPSHHGSTNSTPSSSSRSHSGHPTGVTNAPTATPPPAPAGSGFSTANAGIGGLIRKQEQQMQSVDALTKAALSDLDQLIHQARDVVQIIQRYAVIMQESKTLKDNGEEMSDTTTQIAEANAMEEIMQSIGIVSPVTKLSAGRLYHEQLARQLAELLLQQHRLERLGGMITLTDLYCIYNKARGTELVSPSDLLSACEKMHKLQLGMKLRSFPSGVKVVELDHVDERAFSMKILEYIESNVDYLVHGISISNVALHFNLSYVVAKEKLLVAESQQLICRDESIRGLYFFVNKFSTFQ